MQAPSLYEYFDSKEALCDAMFAEGYLNRPEFCGDSEQVKGFLFGLILLPALVGIMLSARPGGIRRQLQLVARRLRLAFTMAGAFMVGSVLLRLLIQGPVADFGQAILAVVLAGTFVLVSIDPTDQPGATKPRGSQ